MISIIEGSLEFIEDLIECLEDSVLNNKDGYRIHQDILERDFLVHHL